MRGTWVVLDLGSRVSFNKMANGQRGVCLEAGGRVIREVFVRRRGVCGYLVGLWWIKCETKIMKIPKCKNK